MTIESPPGPERRLILSGFTIATLAFVATWTVLLILVPAFRLRPALSEGRQRVEIVAFVVVLLACALAYARYAVTPTDPMLFVAAAVVAVAGTELAFGVILGPDSGAISPQVRHYGWTIGRIVAGLFFLLAAATGGRKPAARPIARFTAAATLGLAVTATADVLLWLWRAHLPAAGAASPGASTSGGGPGLTVGDLIVQVGGALLYVAAAILLERRPAREAIPYRWLGPALLLAAMTHIAYLIDPTTALIGFSWEDLARFLLYLVLFSGLAWEMWTLLSAERRRVAELAAAYQVERRRVEELEHLDRSKADIFSFLTHELSNPVSAIRGFALTLSRRWDELDDSVKLQMIRTLDEQSMRLRDLAEGAATATRLERADFPLTPFPTRAIELVREAADAAPGLDGRLRIIVEEAVDASVVQADRARILQVFRNLLSNASKYSAPASRIDLRVGAEGDDIVFSVENVGPGIDPESIPRLFQRFFRVRSAGMDHVPGSGLGLYISRRIVEGHGGRIWVKSEPGARTKFSFTLRTDEQRAPL